MSAIEHEFLLGRASELYQKVLVVRFRGRYTGMQDARYMEGHLALGFTVFAPDAVVLDFSELELEHGHMLRGVMSPVEPNLEEGFPLYAVSSPENREAILDGLPEEALVGSLDEALRRIGQAGPWAVR